MGWTGLVKDREMRGGGTLVKAVMNSWKFLIGRTTEGG
jgi:hypothetical protein